MVIGSRSIPVRRAMTVGMLSALVCIGVSVLIAFAAHDRAVNRNTHQVEKAVAHTVALLGQNRLPSVLPERDAEAIQVVGLHGQVVATTRQLAGKPPMASFRAGPDDVVLRRDLCPPAGLKGCMTVVSVRYLRPEGEQVIYAARPVVPMLDNPALILFLAGVSVLVTALLVVWVHWRVRADVAQVQGIVAELAEIATTDFGRRVTVPTTYEEFTRLAESVNSTLDRLEAALEPLRRYLFDLSHDLRTPITAIRVRLEEALMYPAETHWPRTATEVLADVEELQALASDLAGPEHKAVLPPRLDRPR